MAMNWRLTFLLPLLLTACMAGPERNPSLYLQLGELPGITAIVDQFLFELADDSDVLPLFADTDIDRFREKLIEQICMLADGPCVYTGDSMQETHRKLNISRAQFSSVVDDLIQAMEALKVPTGAQNSLLQRLAKLYPDITGG